MRSWGVPELHSDWPSDLGRTKRKTGFSWGEGESSAGSVVFDAEEAWNAGERHDFMKNEFLVCIWSTSRQAGPKKQNSVVSKEKEKGMQERWKHA